MGTLLSWLTFRAQLWLGFATYDSLTTLASFLLNSRYCPLRSFRFSFAKNAWRNETLRERSALWLYHIYSQPVLIGKQFRTPENP